MTRVKFAELTYMHFLISSAVDRGKSAGITEVREAMANERTMELIKRYVDPEELEGLPEDELDVAFRKHYVPDETDTLVEDNGLLYLSGNITEILQTGDWTNDRGESLDVSTLRLRI